MRLCTKSGLCALHTWHSLSEKSETSTIISISTQEPNGICAAPNALRECAPRSPKISRKSSEAPLALVRFGKAWSAVHHYQQPDDTFHPIQVVQGTVQRREEFDGDITRSLPALRRCDFLPHFAGERLAVPLRQSSRQINKIAGPHKGHKRRDVAIDHRRGNFRQIDLQSL